MTTSRSVKPTAAVKVSWDMSEEELLAQIETLREIVSDSTETDQMRGDADSRLTKLLESATKRNIAVPDVKVPA